MIRIALVTPVFPYPPDTGIRIRVFHLARYLGRRYDVRVLSTEAGDSPLATATLGVPVVNFPVETGNGIHRRTPSSRMRTSAPGIRVDPGTRERLWEAVGRTGADILQVEMTVGAAMLGFPDRPSPIPLVLDEACAYHVSYRREARFAGSAWRRARALVRYVRLRRYEARLAAAADAVLSPSADVAATISAFAPRTQVLVVPNGVDCMAIRPLPLGTDVLFCGTFAFWPNRNAAVFFLQQVLPRLRAAGCFAKVLLVGAGLDREVTRLAEGDGRVQLPGSVPDMTPWYARAGVVINPMRGGGGTRLKVLEALAAGRPVVTTRTGAEGLQVSHGREVWLADDPASFAAAVERLLRDRPSAEAMGRAGRSLVENLYDWERCLARLDTLYEQLLVDRPRRR